VKTLVIDASIAVKWVIEEVGTSEALVLRRRVKLIAPDLLVAECANIFWKKVRRKELLREEALLAARLLQGADIELLPMRSLFERATRLSIAYDCLYLALAAATDWQFVTADEHFLRKAHEKQRMLRGRIISLNDAAML